MKKLLSITLALCMLLTMFIIPTAATSDVNAGKLYYRFDFSEDTLYTDYAAPVLPDGVSYESFAAVSTAGNNVIEYGKIGDKDALYIRAAGDNRNVVFTPLKEDGTPVVLETGKNYVVEWDYVITRFSGAWARAHIEPFTTLNGATSSVGNRYTAYYTSTTGEGEEATTATNYLRWHTGGNDYLGFGSLFSGNQIVYWAKSSDGIKDADKVVLDAYTKKTETVEGAEGEEATQVVSFELLEDNAATTSKEDVVYDNGVSATGTAYTATQTISIASDEVLADTYNVTKNEDGSYTFNEVNYNNFLGLSLPGGYGTNYYPGKDEKSIDNVQDAEGNWYHRGYSEYYITGLRVYEEGYDFGTVTCVDGANETVVNVVPGEEIEYPAVKAKRGGDVVWSLSADEYLPVPAVAPTENITVYAYNSGVVGFENYFTSQYFHHSNYTNATFSNDFADSGTTSMKFRNYNVQLLTAEPADWTTNWTAYYAYDEATDKFAKLSGEAAPEYAAGTYYRSRTQGEREQGTFEVYDFNAKGKQTYTKKVSLKYYVPEGNQSSIKLQVYQHATGSIWWNTPVAVGTSVTIPAAATGGWKTIDMLVTAEDVFAYKETENQGLYIKATANSNNAYAICYFDDVTVEDIEVDNKVVYHYNDGVTADETVTEGLEIGVAYAIDRVPASAPEGKYFAGWYTDEDLTVAADATVMAPLNGTIELYAKYVDYANGGTFDYKNSDVKAVNGLAFMKDGVYKSTVDETGWQTVNYTEEGAYIGKTTGGAYTFNPTNTDETPNRNSDLIAKGYIYIAGTDAVGSTKYADMAIGEETVLGWNANASLAVKNADGSAFVPKANTEYKVSVKVNVADVGPANATVQLIAGRKMAYTETGANANGASTYGAAVSNEKVTLTTEGEQVLTYTINTGEMADAVPMLALHVSMTGFKAKKVAEANGVASYTLNDGSTVYPFEITGKSEFYVEEIVVTELDSSVTMVIDGNETVIAGVKGDAITYPELPANLSYDHVWSLSADEYVPVPETMDGDITVYAYKNPVLGLENYKGHIYDNGVNISVSDEQAYGGNKSFRYEDIDYAVITADQALAEVTTGDVTTTAWLTSGNQFFWKNALCLDEETGKMVKISSEEAPEFEEGKYFRNRNGMKDHGIALWKLEANKAYKITYKYYVEKIVNNINVSAVFSGDNIWSSSAITAGNAVISKDSAVGEWNDGEIYVNNVSTHTNLYMLFSDSAVAGGDVLYFDDFAVEEVQVVSFIVPEDFVAEVYTGTLNDGVITAYYAIGEEITVPLVVDVDGNPVEIWMDENGKEVSEFVSGGVYAPYVAPAFIYGDCNDDTEIDAADLAALKLYLAGAGEVGLGTDCNGDGEVDAADLAALKLYLAGAGTLGPQA